MPDLKSLFSVCAALAFTLSSLAGAQAAGVSGTVVGFVTARSTSEPVSLADVTIDRFAIATFADKNGVFRLRGLPSGELTIRVRRLGFTPATVTITIAPGREDTVRVALAPLALALDRVRVTDAVCPRRATTESDTATLAILGQIRMNAERNRLLAHEFPFSTSMERTIADAQAEGALVGGRERVRVVRVDTISIAGEHEWHYAPGKLVQRTDAEAASVALEKMIVPQLSDFAEDAFIDNHCFLYAGVVGVDGAPRIRVDFEPISTLREPDVRGSMYLHPANYQLVRTTLMMDRPRGSEVWQVRVDTWFREILPALPVIDRVCMRSTGVAMTASGNRTIPRAAIEEQRVIGFAFERGSPADVSQTPTGALADGSAATPSASPRACARNP